MQLRLILLISILSCSAILIHAQSDNLPQAYSIILGGGAAFPYVEGCKNDFFSKNGNRVGYDLMAEGRYYFMPYLAVGLQYDYLRIADLPDKMHLHFIHPNITLRHLWKNGNRGVFFSLGIGYMNYQERIYRKGERGGFQFQRGYCGISLSAGYEFHITKKVSGMFRLDVLTADWFMNPDARLFNPDPDDDYYDPTYRGWFKNNITFFDLGFALQFGK